MLFLTKIKYLKLSNLYRKIVQWTYFEGAKDGEEQLLC
jgi:hypothetical protein